MRFWAAAAIVAAGVAAYANSFGGAFVFDDTAAIVDNPTIRHLGHIWEILTPPGDRAGTVGGRPLLNLSLALNHAAGGTAVAGYHAVNLAIHLLAALTLFGLVRRTLSLAVRGNAASPFSATSLALGAVLLWTAHPIQTEAVSYVIQRAEALMGLFYLLTLYCFLRSAEPEAGTAGQRGGFGGGWAALSVLSCAAGMATKEVMATAPLLVLLYDRSFLAGSFGAAWRARRPFYLGLAATWLLLALLVFGTHGRGGSAGYGAPAAVGAYLLTQGGAIVHYLRLAFWPFPLIFDYGTILVSSVAAVALPLLLLFILLAGTVWALRRRPGAGFLGAAFFVILAPSSSFIPIATEPIAEHRMYLPLGAVLVLAVAGLYAALEKLRISRGGRSPPDRSAAQVLAVCVVIAIGLGAATVRRNRDYRTAVTLFRATVRDRPDNPRAHNDFGSALFAEGSRQAAFAEFNSALRLQPDYIAAHYNLGALLLSSGHPQEAVPHLLRAVAGPMHTAQAQCNLGEALAKSRRLPEAAEHYAEALRLDPGNLPAAFGLGNTLALQGRYAEAVPVFRRAEALAPHEVGIRNNLANALLFAGDRDAAITEYREALALRPGDASIQENLARALAAGPAR